MIHPRGLILETPRNLSLAGGPTRQLQDLRHRSNEQKLEFVLARVNSPRSRDNLMLGEMGKGGFPAGAWTLYRGHSKAYNLSSGPRRKSLLYKK